MRVVFGGSGRGGATRRGIAWVRGSAGLLAAILGIASVASGLHAQERWTVAGRVVDAASGVALPNARVTLESVGSVLAGDGGIFQFDAVPAGVYRLRAETFGYREAVTEVSVDGDVIVVLALDIVPIEIDSIDVTLRTIDIDGEVYDPRTGASVSGAEVATDQGHRETSRLTGRFDLDDVFDGPPIRVLIRAFGFLPLDTTFVPHDDDRHRFAMAPDPVATRMIDAYVAALDERAGDNMYEYQPALNREELAEFSPNTSLRRVMEASFPRSFLDRIQCFFLDEVEYAWYGSYHGRMSFLEGTVAGELERVELLEFPGEARLLMARIYTRRFFQRQVGSPDELVAPSVIVTWGGTFCR